MVENVTKKKRALWEQPWGYTESLVIAAELLIFGFIVEFITGGKGLSPISMPANLYLLVGFAFILIILRSFYNDNSIIKWLSGIPAAVSSIIAFGLITLLMGFIPQSSNEENNFISLIGLSHLKNSWPILFIQLYLLSSLGLVTIKRIIPFKLKNTGFILNHLGLWITLIAATLGSGDLKTLSINLLEEGKANNIAISQTGDQFKLPFELKLLDFDIDEYVPRLVLANVETGDFAMKKDEAPVYIEKGRKYSLGYWEITIENIHTDAIIGDSSLIDKKTTGSYPAAFVKIQNKSTGHDTSVWLGTGSFAYNPVYFKVTPDTLIGLSMAQPKRFHSKVVVSQNNVSDTVTIEVNKPYTVQGWTIYQLSYDQSKGKWSKLSVLEAVSDPWIKLVYTGIFMMLAGSLFLFWTGRKRVKHEGDQQN
jgi:cytochrome c biogenesis factor